MSLRSPAEITATIRATVGVAKDFDFEIQDAPDGAVVVLQTSPRMLRLGATISGPVLMTLIDTAMYAAVIAQVEHGEFGVTSHLNIEFLRRPAPGVLVAAARILRVGRRQVTATVAVDSGADGKLVAHATGAYALFGPPPV